MCEPATIIAGISAAAGLAGTIMSSNAAQAQQQAIAEQNRATALAQNQAFTARNLAGQAQTAGQLAASQETLTARADAANTMRENQAGALKNYQDIINAQNTQAESLRRTGDTQAQNLLQETNQPALDAAQQQRQQQAAALLAPGVPQGPGPTDPSGTNSTSTDTTYTDAAARRTAQAAANIRTYGGKIAAVGAYDAPLQQTNLAIAENRAGIMPALTAEQLLRAGSATRLLPTQVAYRAATGLGGAQDVLLQSRGQGALDAAGLSYGNTVDIANLTQSDLDTIARNKSQQAQADASFAAQQGQTIKQLGNLGLYAAGAYGDKINSLSSSLFGPTLGDFSPRSAA